MVDASGTPITGVRKLVANDAHACALLEDGAVLIIRGTAVDVSELHTKGYV